MLQPVLSNPWVRAAGVLLAVLLVGVLAYILKPVLVPLFLAFLVAYVLDPVVDYFEARKISRGATIAGLAVLGLVAFISVPLIIVPAIYWQAEQTPPADEEVIGSAWLNRALELLPIEKLAAELERLEEAESLEKGPTRSRNEETGLLVETETPPASVDGSPALAGAKTGAEDKEAAEHKAEAPGDSAEEGQENELDPREVVVMYLGHVIRHSALQFLKSNLGSFASIGREAGANLFGLFSALGSGVLHVVLFLANFALFAFVAGYLLRDFYGLIAGAGELVPPKHRDKTVSIVSQINDQMRSFLRGQITVCLCLGAMYAVGFLIARTPFAILIAGFGTVASFVPFLGVTMVALISVSLTVLQFGLDWHVVVALATIITAQTLEGNVLTPRIVGDQVGLNPVWVILAILVFGNFLGFLGLLLAVPIAAAMKVLVVEAVAYYRKSAVFRGGDAGN